MTVALRTDLNDFLFAPIAQDANGMPLTLLSALARSGVDPWAEAAELAVLSRESATAKLITVLAGVSNGPSPGADTATLASQLVALLHPSQRPRVSSTGTASSRAAVAPQPKHDKLALYYLFALVFMLLGHCVMTSRNAPTPADASQPVSP